MILQSIDYISEQGRIRDDGLTDNAIDRSLAGTPSEGMRSDDYMFFYADIFVESVQYGNRTKLCDLLKSHEGEDQETIYKAVLDFGSDVAGVNPPDYDTRELAKTEINFATSGRQWTYQYCTEFGFFQVPSEEHRMRSNMLVHDYWPKMCERVFEGLDMEKLGLP